MAKKKSKKTQKSEKPKERVTLEAVAAMSDSDDEDIPQSQWNTKAKNLAQAIEEGKFDSLIEKMKGGGSDEEIEEATLGSSSSEIEEDGNSKAEAEEDLESESESEDEKKVATDGEDDEEEDEEEEDDEGKQKLKEILGDKDGENSSDEEEEDKESSDDEDPKMKQMIANNSHNSKALAVVTAELAAAHARLPWAERFEVVPETPLPFGENGDPESNPLDVHDDLKREVAFYNLALEAVHKARKECKKAKIPFSRPDDFFAEMVKTDDHMAKVKDRLIFENKKMDAVAQRKTNREQKLRAKESHANKLAEKSKRKREHFQQVEEWANSVAKNRGGALQDDADEVFLKQRGPNKKREYADKKFGFGGKRGRFKQNDKASMNDLSGFNPRGNFPGGMKRSAKTKGGAGSARQGKRARDASRSRKRS